MKADRRRDMPRGTPRTSPIEDGRMPWYFVYPFFGLHMLLFAGSGFLLAYGDDSVPLAFLYGHGGFAILAYLVFYLGVFGRDAVAWMFVNAALGALVTWTSIDLLLGLFGRRAADYPLHLHVIPFLYLTLYAFLVRQALTDLFGARTDASRQRWVDAVFVATGLGVSGLAWWLGR